jgi:membrane-anchored glycerophosphoryl diester phosphodiesterase (GDPDase)
MIRLVRIVRNVEFAQLFDTFFISAITTILAVRFYLKVTGYPEIGTSNLHISHLLPGSLLMLASVLVLLAAVNRAARGFAAITAGIGFGLCWDELGKFITKDNDYFFHATPGLIYIT